MYRYTDVWVSRVLRTCLYSIHRVRLYTHTHTHGAILSSLLLLHCAADVLLYHILYYNTATVYTRGRVETAERARSPPYNNNILILLYQRRRAVISDSYVTACAGFSTPFRVRPYDLIVIGEIYVSITQCLHYTMDV